MREIERKWLLKRLPSIINNINPTLIEQAYLSISFDREIRVRLSYKLFREPKYIMAFKEGTGMVRDENEIELTKEQFLHIKNNVIKEPFITKNNYLSTIDDSGYIIEINIVDAETENQFYYAEIEFDTIDAADNYKLPQCFIDETDAVDVTYDDRYKMKNYWKRTRLDNK